MFLLIERICFTITIYDGEAVNFGQVSNSFVRILDEEKNAELIRYDLGEDFSIETVVGELYRHAGDWKFNAIGSGFQGGLASLCNNFGFRCRVIDLICISIGEMYVY